MRGNLNKEGDYELFETTEGHQILHLNKKDWYALVNGQQGKIIVKSDSDHEKDHTIQKGQFYLADFEDDPKFKDMPHLFLKKGEKFTEYILPNGLPTEKDNQKKLIETDEKLAEDKVMDHVKGRGNKGDEKQYEGKEEGLRNKSKKELEQKAKEEGISGRSKMKKGELVDELKEKKNK